MAMNARAVRRASQGASPYITDPGSVGSAPGIVLPFSVFDTARLMDALRRGQIDGIPPGVQGVPTDDELIASVVAHGMPKWSADQMRYNPALRLHYYLFWLDVREAAKGEKESKDRVDAAIATWAHMRKEELISDIPNHTVGFWER